MRNAIREVRGPNNDILKEQSDIKMEAERHFKEFLTHQPEDFQGMSVEELQDTLEFRCSDTENTHLTREVTEEEIQKTLFAMPRNKSPRLDGYTTIFQRSLVSYHKRIYSGH